MPRAKDLAWRVAARLGNDWEPLNELPDQVIPGYSWEYCECDFSQQQQQQSFDEDAALDRFVAFTRTPRAVDVVMSHKFFLQHKGGECFLFGLILRRRDAPPAAPFV